MVENIEILFYLLFLITIFNVVTLTVCVRFASSDSCTYFANYLIKYKSKSLFSKWYNKSGIYSAIKNIFYCFHSNEISPQWPSSSWLQLHAHRDITQFGEEIPNILAVCFVYFPQITFTWTAGVCALTISVANVGIWIWWSLSSHWTCLRRGDTVLWFVSRKYVNKHERY